MAANGSGRTVYLSIQLLEHIVSAEYLCLEVKAIAVSNGRERTEKGHRRDKDKKNYTMTNKYFMHCIRVCQSDI